MRRARSPSQKTAQYMLQTPATIAYCTWTWKETSCTNGALSQMVLDTPIGDGTFNEPWGIAIAPDGSVYVTDTWNHRIEKFTSTGKFITAWGIFGQGETPDSFYGPRGLAVDAEGRVYVTDTGNKRIAVFDSNGNFITDFGSAGFDPGQFDEPVGVAIDKNGTVYVVDTWNQRIQTFTPVETEGSLSFVPA